MYHLAIDTTGNLLSRMMAEENKTLAEMRELIRSTFDIEEVVV